MKLSSSEPVLRPLIDRFLDYLRLVIDEGKIPHLAVRSSHRDAAVEVLERLRQLDFILRRLVQVEPRYRQAPNDNDAYLEARTLTESFYYLAFRTRVVLQSLPSLDSFECVDIRDIRNHLIEHPEGKSSGIRTQSFGWGAEAAGPLVKPLRATTETQQFGDKGLFINAAAFRDQLMPLLDRTLAKAGA